MTTVQKLCFINVNLQIKKNPEYARMVPPLSFEEKEALGKSIKKNGQYYNGKVNEKGEILDGHHRFDICTEEAIDFKYDEMTFEDKLNEREFVLDINGKRRQLNEFGKALIVYEYEKIEKERARLRQLSTLPQKGQKGFESQSNQSVMWGPNEPHTDTDTDKFSGKSAEIAAKKAGCKSTTTYKRCKKIIECAPKEIQEKIRTGKAEINTYLTREKGRMGHMAHMGHMLKTSNNKMMMMMISIQQQLLPAVMKV